HHAELLFPVERRRHGHFAQSGYRGKWDETPVSCPDEDVFQIRRVIDGIGGGKKLHVEAVVVDEDRPDLAAVKQGLQGFSQTGDADAEVGRALAVDLDLELWLRCVVRKA